MRVSDDEVWSASSHHLVSGYQISVSPPNVTKTCKEKDACKPDVHKKLAVQVVCGEKSREEKQ